jgi:integrase
VTTLKTAWHNLRNKAGVKGLWHNNRHTLSTKLAENGPSDQTIMHIAGHVSKQMLKLDSLSVGRTESAARSDVT